MTNYAIPVVALSLVSYILYVIESALLTNMPILPVMLVIFGSAVVPGFLIYKVMIRTSDVHGSVHP
jgi:hypothetical protein